MDTEHTQRLLVLNKEFLGLFLSCMKRKEVSLADKKNNRVYALKSMYNIDGSGPQGN